MTINVTYVPVDSFWNGKENRGWMYCKQREHAVYVDEYGKGLDYLRVPSGLQPEEIISHHMKNHPCVYIPVPDAVINNHAFRRAA